MGGVVKRSKGGCNVRAEKVVGNFVKVWTRCSFEVETSTEYAVTLLRCYAVTLSIIDEQ